jgi:hypothetical protein
VHAEAVIVHLKASIFFFFFNFNRNQTENDRYWQKLLFTFCKMFENIQFFSHLH